MAQIPFTGTGSLFATLGRVGEMAQSLYKYQTASIPTDNNMLEVQLAQQQQLWAALAQYQPTLLTNTSAYGNQLAATAQTILNWFVNTYAPTASLSNLGLNLSTVVAQMKAAGQTVQKCNVSSLTQAAVGNNGNGVCVISSVRGDGLTQENMFAEIASISCTLDAQSGSATKFQETFTYSGQSAAPNGNFDSTWPRGSGTTTAFKAIDANASTGTIITNGNFENFSSPPTPNGWTITTGASQLGASTSVFYDGAASLALVGDSSSLPALRQPISLQPLTPYAVNVMLNSNFVPAAGVLSLELTNGAGTVLSSYTVNVNKVPTNTWTSYNFSLQTPAAIPSSGFYIRLRMTTPLSTGSTLYIDHLAIAAHTMLYAGGPLAAIFSGNVPFILNDSFQLTTTNDRGGAVLLSTFQTLFDRCFNMRAYGLLLPSSATPTISDTLITSTGTMLDFSKPKNSGFICLV